MLGSPLLGAAVGLVLLFATTSLLCSGITESLSNLFQMRAKYLLTGLRAMLDGPETQPGAGKATDKQLHEDVKNPKRTADAVTEMRKTGAAPAAADTATGATESAAPAVAAVATGAGEPVTAADPATGTAEPVTAAAPATGAAEPITDATVVTKALFDSPLLTSMQSRRVRPFGTGSVRNPQYVSAQMFARALIDLLVPAEPDGEVPADVDIKKLAAAVNALPSPTLRRQLTAFLAAAGGRVDAFEQSLEHWYDEEMAKISGWYKRWARVALGVTGLIVAGLLNLDTLQVAHSLYVDTPIQQAVIATADTGTLCQNAADRATCVTGELAAFKAAALPIGWPDPALGSPWSILLKIIGWGVTAFAVSFGAPFWFEALSKLGSLRNTGTRPEDRAGTG